jgi:hypothetical protein
MVVALALCHVQRAGDKAITRRSFEYMLLSVSHFVVVYV